KTIGFGTNASTTVEEDKSLMQQVIPEDLLNFGLIPEFIGRLPILSALEKLTEEDLVHILTEPKNALVKQYKTLLGLDGVELKFTPQALHAIANQAISRNTGARGLRSIIENVMRDIMFEIPSRNDVAKVTVNKKTVIEGAEQAS
ncbi:ATP-dependent Clp protease ATP-binding subunit ClpX, partial [Enterococcus faecium]|nr:ATP-dependent Clp protease ATP-binding subunit ClpX [Enterococcus faecium]